MGQKGADIGSKRLISLAPEAWVRWLLEDARVEVLDLLSTDFQWVSRESDVLLRVRRPDVGEFLVLNEMQLRPDPRIARRMAAYAALARERYNREVYPVVVNILPPKAEGALATQYRSEFLGLVAQQDYRVVNLWEVEAGRVLAEELLPLLPFVPVMQGGQEEQVLLQTLVRLRAEPILAELEPLLAFLASFVLDTPFIQRIMRWDMAVLRESPWYQEIWKEGLEQGLEQARRVLADQLLHVLAHRLGEGPDDVQAAIYHLSLDELRTLLDPALDATTWAEFQAYLPVQRQQPGDKFQIS